MLSRKLLPIVCFCVALSASAQLSRHFNYSLPQTSSPTPQQQLAIEGKTLADKGLLVAADSVLRLMEADHPHYAYTQMLHAYLCQQRAEQLSASSDATDRANMRNELNEAASYLEQLADKAKDSASVCRSLLLSAADLRYQAEDDANARLDFQRILSLSPSRQDSLDVLLMQADFEQMDSLYAEAEAHYALYLNSVSPLPHDAYTANAAVGLLQCVNRQKDYARLASLADRFLQHDPQDIRFYRYRRNALQGLAAADSASYAAPYRASVDYVLRHQFPDSLYTYDDYYAASAVAFQQQDFEANVACLQRCVELYEDPRVTRSQTADYLFERLDLTQRILGQEEGRAITRQQYAAFKQRKLGDSYEPLNDQITTGIRYYNALIQVKDNDPEALRLHALADSCFMQALRRTETVDSLMPRRREVISRYIDVNNVAAANTLVQPDNLDSLYARAVGFYAAKRDEYLPQPDCAETVDDLTAYIRKFPTIVVARTPDEAQRARYYALADSRLREDFEAATEAQLPDILRQRRTLVQNIVIREADPQLRLSYLHTLDSLHHAQADHLAARPQMQESVAEVLDEHYQAYINLIGQSGTFADSATFRTYLVERGDTALARYRRHLPQSYRTGMYRGQLYAQIDTSTKYDNPRIVDYYTQATEADLYLASAREQLAVQRYLMVHWYFQWMDEDVEPLSDEDKLYTAMLRRTTEAVYELNPDDTTAAQLKQMKALWNTKYDEACQSGQYIYRPADPVYESLTAQ